MPIQVVYGDVLECTSGILVHGCNAQGAMGAGFAKKIATLYPEVFWDYKRTFTRGRLALGQCVVSQVRPSLYVVSAITQEFYGRDPSRVYVSYEAIQVAFEQVNTLALALGLPVMFPAIGAGLANGSWPRIQDIIEETLAPAVHATLFIYAQNTVSA